MRHPPVRPRRAFRRAESHSPRARGDLLDSAPPQPPKSSGAQVAVVPKRHRRARPPRQESRTESRFLRPHRRCSVGPTPRRRGGHSRMVCTAHALRHVGPKQLRLCQGEAHRGHSRKSVKAPCLHPLDLFRFFAASRRLTSHSIAQPISPPRAIHTTGPMYVWTR